MSPSTATAGVLPLERWSCAKIPTAKGNGFMWTALTKKSCQKSGFVSTAEVRAGHSPKKAGENDAVLSLYANIHFSGDCCTALHLSLSNA